MSFHRSETWTNSITMQSESNASTVSMCCYWLHSRFRWRMFLKLACTVLTFLLICQELFTFVVTKPTSMSTQEKELQMKDLPEVFICLEPGADIKVLKKYGYHPNVYYRGSSMDKFIGWNGNVTQEIRVGYSISDYAVSFGYSLMRFGYPHIRSYEFPKSA